MVGALSLMVGAAGDPALAAQLFAAAGQSVGTLFAAAEAYGHIGETMSGNADTYAASEHAIIGLISGLFTASDTPARLAGIPVGAGTAVGTPSLDPSPSSMIDLPGALPVGPITVLGGSGIPGLTVSHARQPDPPPPDDGGVPPLDDPANQEWIREYEQWLGQSEVTFPPDDEDDGD